MLKDQSQELQEKTGLYCNVCGKMMVVESGILKEDMIEVSKEWGYFSKRDLEVHKFHICENCYEKMISNFKIPIEISSKKEVL